MVQVKIKKKVNVHEGCIPKVEGTTVVYDLINVRL